MSVYLCILGLLLTHTYSAGPYPSQE